MRDITNPPAIVRQVDDLESLALDINREHEAGEDSAGKRLAHYHKAGEGLLRAKEKCRRGEWLKWLKGKVRCGKSRAYQYMEWAKFPVTGNLEEDEAAWRRISGNGKRHEDEEESLPDFVTLEQWSGMAKAERAELLKRQGTTCFNEQGDNQNIEWALWSWNPVTGCLHNCPYCYARDIAERFYDQKFAPSLWPGRLKAAQNTKVPQEKIDEEPEGSWRRIGLKNVFTCSMADLFGRWVPAEWIEAVLAEVRAAPDWNFLFLTKFPVRMAEFSFPANAWVGTTVDCQARVANAEKSFRRVKAGVKWLSIEPLIEPLAFSDIGAFQWIVLGGASQSSKTPAWIPPRRWVMDLEEQATKAGVSFYEKSNLRGERIRGYPGGKPWAEPAAAPAALRYLPDPERK
jgi:protein gp37